MIQVDRLSILHDIDQGDVGPYLAYLCVPWHVEFGREEAVSTFESLQRNPIISSAPKERKRIINTPQRKKEVSKEY
jgi:hypothetical protein